MKHLAEIFLKWDLFQTEVVQKIIIQIFYLTISSEYRLLDKIMWENTEYIIVFSLQ